MVHETRLITSLPTIMILITYTAIVILSIFCQVCLAQDDVSRNLVRDNVEMGNPYIRTSSKGTTHHGDIIQKRKHPNHHHRNRQQSRYPQHDLSLQSASEEEGPSVLAENAVRQEEILPEATSNNHFPVGSNNNNNNEETHSPSHKLHQASAEESEEDDDNASCPLCAAAQRNSKIIASLDEDTLRAVRIEIVKKQILKKLRLKEPPKVDNIQKGHNTIIPPIVLGNPELVNSVRSDQDDDHNMDLEDFYGKTEQIIVLPQDEVKGCSSWGSKPISEAASCFVFHLPKEVRSTQISSAELWVYKFADVVEDDDNDSSNNASGESRHNFSTSEITFHYSRSARKPAFQFHSMATRENLSPSAGWINFNITDRARKWLVTETQEHTIKISCSTCSRDLHEPPFDSVDEQQPFIVFNVANGKRKRRHRRSLNCTPGVKECCRESLYISFEEIKWDWVLEPKGFNAYYCKGKCHGDAALAHTVTRHSGIMIDYVKTQGGVNNQTVELVPCCTATEMSSMSLIYRETSNSTTLIQKTNLPNMIVKSCGCK